MQLDTNLMKTIAKQGFKTILTILFLTGVGIFINWILLIFLWPELSILFDASVARGGHGGAGAALLVLFLMIVMNWQASLLFLTFFLVFPVLHFFFSKKYAVTVAIYNLLKDKKEYLIKYLFQKFFEKVNSKVEWLNKLNSSGSIQVVNEYLPVYIKKMEGMPFPIRMILKFLFAKLNLLGIVSAVISEEGKVNISLEELINKVSAKVNETLDEKFFSPSFSSNLILSGFNFVCFIGIKILI
ncbi:MAG: hypothetical protein IPL26_12350 [Leptospiraceae bacterium]|nr:hypothetical protein [Leptospiraceae bacterium]